MKIYYTPGTCSTVPRILVAEAGIACEQESVSFKTRQTASGADYLQINPNGYVPALQLDDGTVLTEVAAISQYIADLAPEKNLAPANGTLPRYQLQAWLNFIGTELHKGFSTLFDRVLNDEAKQPARDKLAKRLAYVNDQLAGKDFLVGSHFTAADAYLFVVLSWASLVKVELAGLDNLNSFIERINARPSVQSVKMADKK